MNKYIQHKLYRIKWALAPYIKFKSSVHLDLELNTSCNQKCISCWQNNGISIKTMSIKTASTYIRQGAIMGIKSIKFNLRGEPLLSPILIQCITYAKKYGYIDIMINTNGILLSAWKVFELGLAGLTSCTISVDSLDRDIYCKLHGCSENDYISLIDNLMNLKIMHEVGQVKFKVRLNRHINQYNHKENLDAYKEFSQFKLVVRNTENRKGHHIALDKKRKRKILCSHMHRRLTVLANRKVFPCCVCYDEPDDIRLDSENRLKDVWNGDERRVLLTNYKNGFYTESCKNCTSGDIYK